MRFNKLSGGGRHWGSELMSLTGTSVIKWQSKAQPVGLREEAGRPAVSYSFIQHIFIEALLRARHRLLGCYHYGRDGGVGQGIRPSLP